MSKATGLATKATTPRDIPPSNDSRPRPRERLAEVAARLRKALDSGACGPLIIAEDVVRIEDNWPAYADEAGGKTATQWCSSVFGAGRTAAWFRRRHEAVQRIGEHARRTWDHDAANWAARNIASDVDLKKLNEAVIVHMNEHNGRVPLTLVQVCDVARHIGLLGKPRRKTCERCKELEAALVAAGVAVPKCAGRR